MKAWLIAAMSLLMYGAPLAFAQQQGVFGGPAILSRGTRPIGRADGRPLRIRGYLGLGANYTDGLGAPGTGPDGKPYDLSGYGGSLSAGVYGARATNRETVAFDYHLGMNLFSRGSYYTGVNQALSLSYTRQINSRWSMFSSASATQANNALGQNRTPITQPYFVDPYTPGNELFDNRMYAFSGGVGAAYQASSRWTFAMGGSASTTVRRSNALVGYYGYGTMGEASYMLSRKTGVGAIYSYSHTEHKKGFGQADSMSWMGTFSQQLSRIWSFAGGAGAYRAETDRLQSFQIDPLLAAILGTTSGVERFHSINYGLSLNASLNASLKKQNVNFFYSRGVNPGNGVYLTSEMETAGSAYSYNGFRHLGFGAGGNWSKMKPLLKTTALLGNYESYGGFVGTSYRLTSFMHVYTSFDVRRSVLKGPEYLRSRYSIQAGISFSPGEIPLSIW